MGEPGATAGTTGEGVMASGAVSAAPCTEGFAAAFTVASTEDGDGENELIGADEVIGVMCGLLEWR